jgi:hypothetical protein
MITLKHFAHSIQQHLLRCCWLALQRETLCRRGGANTPRNVAVAGWADLPSFRMTMLAETRKLLELHSAALR